MSRLAWGVTLVLVCFTGLTKAQTTPEESSPQDGFYNNLYQPDWGIAGSRLVRRVPPGYSDGTYQMAGPRRPNPLSISQHVHSGRGATASTLGRNALLVFFTQLVLDEVLSTGQPGCPPEYENMELPSDHPLRNQTDRPLVYQRSAYDQRTGYSPNTPRQQTNGVTSFLDGGVIYGTSRMWTNHLRSYRDGQLKADSTVLVTSFPETNALNLPLANPPVPRDHTLKPVSRLFALGNSKGHETPFLQALQVVWFRYHNKMAADVKQATPGMSDEQIFTATRRRVVATFQSIVFYDWLPALLGGNSPTPSSTYPGYDPEVRPDVAQEFRTAMNFRYSLTPAAVWAMESNGAQKGIPGRGPNDEARNKTSIRLCNQFWDSRQVVKDNLDAILRGMLVTLSEKEDEIVAPDLRASWYGPYEYSRQDIVAVELQRDRDHGLSDLNTVLHEYERAAISKWTDMKPRAQELKNLYPQGTLVPSDVDFFSGAMTSKEATQGIPDIFREIIVQQFEKIRRSDRFWFESKKNGLFSDQERSAILNTTFGDVLLATTKLTSQDLTAGVFTCTGTTACQTPPAVDDDSDLAVDVCSPLQTYDYFTGSEFSFPLSFAALFLVVPGSIVVLLLLVKRRERHHHVKVVVKRRSRGPKNPNKHRAKEWQGTKSQERNVSVEFNASRKKVMVRDGRGKELRFIDLRQQSEARLRTTGQHGAMVALALDGEVDLILHFEDTEYCQDFIVALRNFLEGIGVRIDAQIMSEAEIKAVSVNRDQRQETLDEFFRIAVMKATAEDGDKAEGLDPARADRVARVKLTRTEFADAMGVLPSSIFVRNVFLLVDKDNDGFVTFHEFISLFGVFLKGSADDKAKLMFNVYDVRRRGVLTREDFTKMIKSLLELSENASDIKDISIVTQLVDVMFRDAGLENKQEMTFEDFRKVFASKEYSSTLQAATLAEQGVVGKGAAASKGAAGVGQRKSRIVNSYRKQKRPAGTKRPAASDTVDDGNPQQQQLLKLRRHNRRSQVRASVHQPGGAAPQTPQGPGGQYFSQFKKFVEVFYLHIFWTTLYTLVCCGIFIERAYFYAAGREHAGLRRLSGAWTTAMIRGSASVIMFTYVSLLLTMCRNVITRMRETFLHRFVPFDSAVAFHKYIAVLAMGATIIHIFGHGTNLYCMCTQSTINTNCFFREYFTSSTGFATFHYWAFQTLTGLAGVLVTVVIFIMYVFAAQFSRRKVFTAFWATHSLYPLVYLLTFLHGAGRLVQDPIFPWYLIGPLVIFVLDRLMSASRNRIEIPVIEAQLLPSDVIKLVFKRPSNVTYRSGQWVRIACLQLGAQEYHPFTLTSAPHEPHLSLHVRAVGPWTRNLRQAYDSDILGGDPYPKLYLDGPFGEGHQDWLSCDVAVLVGGGIGVTPFASILKDIAFKSRTGAPISCQKVYFIWVTRTQKSFEWLTDVIRDVESTDDRRVVDTHIFITQFKQKYDLRTTMLYICERHFQKVDGRSLFTGLSATTHFGRPDFVEFLYSLQLEHPKVNRFGVFSCGPGPMTSSVQSACNTLNRTDGCTYTHHYENF